MPFYFGKADSHVNEKLPHTVKNSLFPDFRAFCCRYFICRILMEAKYGQRKTNVYNLREDPYLLLSILQYWVEQKLKNPCKKCIFVMDARIKRSK